MNYDEKYPDIVAALKARYEPGPTVVVDGLEATERVYPCNVCGTPTQWCAVGLEVEPYPHLCSVDCMVEFTKIPLTPDPEPGTHTP